MYRADFQHLYHLERKRIPPTPREHLRLHRLERPKPWPQWPGTNFYPDYAHFQARLSEFAGVPPDRIVVGQGIEGLTRDLVMLTCEHGDAVAFTSPTCAMFGLYADIFGADRVEIITDPDHPPDMEDICEAIAESVRLLILPNPGQPVDICLGLDDLRWIAGECADNDTVFAIDEAYHGFGAPTALPLINEFDNVIVLRTFSKAFGGAALRVGYAMGSHRAIKPLEACRQSGEIAGPSIEIAVQMMDHWSDVIEPGIREVIDGRDWLRERLTADDFKVRGHWANHCLIDMGDIASAALVAKRLLARGVHVRRNAAPLERHLMVTCGSVPLMRRFHQEFEAARE